MIVEGWAVEVSWICPVCRCCNKAEVYGADQCDYCQKEVVVVPPVPLSAPEDGSAPRDEPTEEPPQKRVQRPSSQDSNSTQENSEAGAKLAGKPWSKVHMMDPFEPYL